MLLWMGYDVDQQNSMIDKTVVLEARADVCIPKPREFEEFVFAVKRKTALG
jgi:DNA-binding response OmpR family regulator